ncbi:hypothetical protein [Enterovirga rhinocerotis]|nr:hypothetical protein [Enterovirga rhinocerotis]
MKAPLEDDFRRADEALYRAKADGRDRVRLHAEAERAPPNENRVLAMVS